MDGNSEFAQRTADAASRAQMMGNNGSASHNRFIRISKDNGMLSLGGPSMSFQNREKASAVSNWRVLFDPQPSTSKDVPRVSTVIPSKAMDGNSEFAWRTAEAMPRAQMMAYNGSPSQNRSLQISKDGRMLSLGGPPVSFQNREKAPTVSNSRVLFDPQPSTSKDVPRVSTIIPSKPMDGNSEFARRTAEAMPRAPMMAYNGSPSHNRSLQISKDGRMLSLGGPSKSFQNREKAPAVSDSAVSVFDPQPSTSKDVPRVSTIIPSKAMDGNSEFAWRTAEAMPRAQMMAYNGSPSHNRSLQISKDDEMLSLGGPSVSFQNQEKAPAVSDSAVSVFDPQPSTSRDAPRLCTIIPSKAIDGNSEFAWRTAEAMPRAQKIADNGSPSHNRSLQISKDGRMLSLGGPSMSFQNQEKAPAVSDLGVSIFDLQPSTSRDAPRVSTIIPSEAVHGNSEVTRRTIEAMPRAQMMENNGSPSHNCSPQISKDGRMLSLGGPSVSCQNQEKAPAVSSVFNPQPSTSKDVPRVSTIIPSEAVHGNSEVTRRTAEAMPRAQMMADNGNPSHNRSPQISKDGRMLSLGGPSVSCQNQEKAPAVSSVFNPQLCTSKDVPCVSTIIPSEAVHGNSEVTRRTAEDGRQPRAQKMADNGNPSERSSGTASSVNFGAISQNEIGGEDSKRFSVNGKALGARVVLELRDEYKVPLRSDPLRRRNSEAYVFSSRQSVVVLERRFEFKVPLIPDPSRRRHRKGKMSDAPRVSTRDNNVPTTSRPVCRGSGCVKSVDNSSMCVTNGKAQPSGSSVPANSKIDSPTVVLENTAEIGPNSCENPPKRKGKRKLHREEGKKKRVRCEFAEPVPAVSEYTSHLGWAGGFVQIVSRPESMEETQSTTEKPSTQSGETLHIDGNPANNQDSGVTSSGANSAENRDDHSMFGGANGAKPQDSHVTSSDVHSAGNMDSGVISTAAYPHENRDISFMSDFVKTAENHNFCFIPFQANSAENHDALVISDDASGANNQDIVVISDDDSNSAEDQDVCVMFDDANAAKNLEPPVISDEPRSAEDQDTRCMSALASSAEKEETVVISDDSISENPDSVISDVAYSAENECSEYISATKEMQLKKEAEAVEALLSLCFYKKLTKEDAESINEMEIKVEQVMTSADPVVSQGGNVPRLPEDVEGTPCDRSAVDPASDPNSGKLRQALASDVSFLDLSTESDMDDITLSFWLYLCSLVRPQGFPDQPSMKFKCFICSEPFPSFVDLEAHSIARHREAWGNLRDPYLRALNPYAPGGFLEGYPRFKFKCVFCSRLFSHNAHLEAHLAMKHRGVEPYECTFCSKRFESAFDLSSHLNEHAYRNDFPHLPM